MIKVDCKKIASNILDDVRCQVENSSKNKMLVIFTAGDDPASASYMRGKINDCDKCGIGWAQIRVRDESDLISQIYLENNSEKVGGIIVQLPLPAGFNEEKAVQSVRIDKDVDGFKFGSRFLPCTPEGIIHILNCEIGDDLTGKTVLLIGKGKLVGKPLIDLLLDRGCTITVAHSKTQDLDSLLAVHHDIVITGVGKAGLVDLRKVDAGIVVDAGISRAEDGKLCGDCFGFDPEDGSSMKVTTVPGGVGLLTRAMLMKHMGEVNS